MSRHSKPEEPATPEAGGEVSEVIQRELDDLRARYPKELALLEGMGEAGRARGQVDLYGKR